MLEEYFLLVRRIPGLSLSLDDYWCLDTWTTQKLLDLEQSIIDREIENNPDSKDKYTEHHEGNSEEIESLVEDMQDEL